MNSPQCTSSKIAVFIWAITVLLASHADSVSDRSPFTADHGSDRRVLRLRPEEKKNPNKHENECRFRLRQQRSASRLLIGGASINMQSCTSNHLIHASPHPHHVSIPRVPVFSCFWAGSERLEKHGRAWLVQRAWQWGRGVGDRDCLFVGVRSFEGGGGVVGQKRGGACMLNTAMRSSRCHWLRKGRWPSKPIKN